MNDSLGPCSTSMMEHFAKEDTDEIPLTVFTWGFIIASQNLKFAVGNKSFEKCHQKCFQFEIVLKLLLCKPSASNEVN